MTREKPGFRYGNYEKESFMLSVFIVTEVLSPKLYQNITGCSLSPVLFPVSLGLQLASAGGVDITASCTAHTQVSD